MGVSGSGKSTVGAALAHGLGWDFFDGDDFHPAENVAKMSAGIPLNDNDRTPWLKRLQLLIRDQLAQDAPLVLASSALKQSYRDILLDGNPQATLVYLQGSFDTIWSRMKARGIHFMGPEMLRSQFEALEEPAGILTVSIELSVEELVSEIIQNLDI